MKIFNKLVNILFDEQEEEIPVITKSSTEKREPKKNNTPADDEVVVTKVERASVKVTEDDDLFDMPKFKEETKIEEEQSNTKTFNFPAIDDDDFGVFEDKKPVKKAKEKEKKESRFDFLTSTEYKKSDSYTSNRNNIYDSSYNTDASEDKKPFTLSPIISPVYGILNENYKKEDIVTRNSAQDKDKSSIDLDEVRKKAYGSLEDEITNSLNKEEAIVSNASEDVEDELLNTLSDDGISIDDLLGNDYQDDASEEVFDQEKVLPSKEETDSTKEDNSEEVSIEEDGDDDLFDLIDSIYSGKDNE